MSTFLDVMRSNQSLVVREVNNCKRSVHLQLRMLQYLLLVSFPGLYTPHYKMSCNFTGKKLGGEGEACSERWTSGVNLEGWYIILYNYRYYIGFLTVHF